VLILPMLFVLAIGQLAPLPIVECKDHSSKSYCLDDCTCAWCPGTHKCEDDRRSRENACTGGSISNECEEWVDNRLIFDAITILFVVLAFLGAVAVYRWYKNK
jgi:hypothetical protein